MVYSGQGWNLPMMLGHKSLFKLALCLKWTAPLLHDPCQLNCFRLYTWNKIRIVKERTRHTKLHKRERDGQNTISPFNAYDTHTPPPTPPSNHYKAWKPKANNCPIWNDFMWDLGTSLHSLLWTSTLAPGPWPWGAPEQWCYPARLQAASASFLLCVFSPLSPLRCNLPLLSIAGERLCEQRGRSLGELFLNPLRESPRVLWCSGFKAWESLHLMWNIQPAGIISQSIHLLPHAAMTVASYLTLLWCLPR